MNNIIKYEDIKKNMQEKEKDAKKALVDLTMKYIEDYDTGDIHSFFIDMFEEENPEDAGDIVVAITKMSNYIYEHDIMKIIENIVVDPDPILMDLADFYPYFCCICEENPDISGYLAFHYPDYTPAIIGCAEMVINVFEITEYSEYFDEIVIEKKDGWEHLVKVYDFINSGSSDGITCFMDKEYEAIGVWNRNSNEYNDIIKGEVLCENLLKALLYREIDEGGYIIHFRIIDSTPYLTIFSAGENNIKVIHPDDKTEDITTIVKYFIEGFDVGDLIKTMLPQSQFLPV